LSGWVQLPQIAAEEFVLMAEQTKGVRTHFNVVHVVHVDGRRSLKCVALIPLWRDAGTNGDHVKSDVKHVLSGSSFLFIDETFCRSLSSAWEGAQQLLHSLLS
jgi:hypothetical protein